MIEYSMSQYHEMIENYLNVSIPKTIYGDEIVAEAMRYSLFNSGKRIRPILTLEFCRICGEDVRKALPLACAIEMIHTYSLIHDDLPCMDNDDMRRGKPSCHKKYGYEYALLAGDGLLTLAFETVCKAELEAVQIVKAVKVLAECSGYQGMIGGQVVDLRSEGKKIGIEKLKTMDSLKTGKLIECAVMLGCIAGNANEKKMSDALSFASSLGTAFQIVDDILDVTATEDKLGKPIGSDKENEKSTYVALLGIEKSKKEAKKLTDIALDAVNNFGVDGKFLNSLAKLLLERDY